MLLVAFLKMWSLSEQFMLLNGGAYIKKTYYPNTSTNKVLKQISSGEYYYILAENKIRWLITTFKNTSVYTISKRERDNYIVGNTPRNINLLNNL